MPAKTVALVAVAEESEHPVSDQTRCGLMSGKHEHHEHVGDLRLGSARSWSGITGFKGGFDRKLRATLPGKGDIGCRFGFGAAVDPPRRVAR